MPKLEIIPVRHDAVGGVRLSYQVQGQSEPTSERLPVAEGLQMKPRNPFTFWIVWPVLTLGIYHLVWYYKIHREMAELDRRRQVPVVGPMLVLLLLSWTVVAPLASYYNTGNRIRNAQRAAG